MDNSVDIIIPARGGSQGIIRKNLIDLGGKPLIAWAIEISKKVENCRRIIVSTDDREIASIAREWGAEAPYYRPTKISDSYTHPVFSILYDFEWCEKNNITLPEFITMILPTSPFRTHIDIDSALSIYINSHCESIVSVYDSGRMVRATRKATSNGYLVPINEKISKKKHLRRQDVGGYYTINGCFYISKPDFVKKYKSFISQKNVMPYVMKDISAIDIDTYDDLEIARHLIPLLEEAIDKNLAFDGGNPYE